MALIETRTPLNACLHCGKKIDACGGARAPHEGDISVCAYCGAVQAFGADLRLRGLFEHEVEELAADEELLTKIRRAVGAVRFMRASVN